MSILQTYLDTHRVSRYFTAGIKPGQSVYDMFAWKRVNVKIQDYSTGAIIFEAEDLEFPDHYSQMACDIIAKMYFRKAGVPTKSGHEESMRQVCERMVNFWVKAAVSEKLIRNDKNQIQILHDELCYMILSQMWAPNSPQWFNTGLKLAYGIDADAQGLNYYDEKEKKVKTCKTAYERSQASACFIVGVHDSLLGEQSLMDNLTTASRLFKYGSGIGINWSKIRAAGESLSSGGKSSGLLSFQKVFDRNAGAIKSGGTTRRAAVMEVLDIDHPEIIDFIRWKAREEDKVVALGKMGYDTSITGEAYETVSGQNVNNSVSIPDRFMDRITGDDGKWELLGRVDPEVDCTIDAYTIWDEIARAAWRCGDPGIQFHDTINRYNTCAEDGEIVASNPCSEFFFLNDSACNLATINIMKFLMKTGDGEDRIDLDGFMVATFYSMLALEATVHMGCFPTPQIAYNSAIYRPCGLGFGNLAALLMSLALPYSSRGARKLAGLLASCMTAMAYATSAAMAKHVGPFERYEANQKSMHRVLKQHQQNAMDLYNGNHAHYLDTDQIGLDDTPCLITKELEDTVKEIWKDVISLEEKYGVRNAQTTLLAPTGTISFAMDFSSTSIEPFFSHKTYKKIVDGSTIMMINQMIPTALKKLGYDAETIQGISDYIINGNGKIEGAPGLKEEHLSIFDTANRCGTGTRYISPEAHVYMVAAIQPHISGGISKTVNLPADATVQDVKNIYLLAWKLGCKCITIYRDGCKVVQPLNTTIPEEPDANDLSQLSYYDLLNYAMELQQKLGKPKSMGMADETQSQQEDRVIVLDEDNQDADRLIREKLPYEPRCIKNAVRMDGHTYHIQRSFYDDGRLGEIFVSVGKQGNTIKGLTEVLCIMISKCLQYGIDPAMISEILRSNEFQPNGMVQHHPNIKAASSIPDLISKFIDISIGDYRFCQVKPDSISIDEPVDATAQRAKASAIHQQVAMDLPDGDRIYGVTCPSCGSSDIIKAGTCQYCRNCGMSSGCS